MNTKKANKVCVKFRTEITVENSDRTIAAKLYRHLVDRDLQAQASSHTTLPVYNV